MDISSSVNAQVFQQSCDFMLNAVLIFLGNLVIIELAGRNNLYY